MYKIPANTLFIGKKLVYVPECHSTNTLAAELADRESVVEGTVIITNNQYKGRGQRGNQWISEPGKNLTLSLILKPSFLRADQQFRLTQIIALAISDYSKEKTEKSVKIKWPNDVLINERKVCGILIENSIAGESIQTSIVGIGLNVNQAKFETTKATSLSLEANHEFDLQTELSNLLQALEVRFMQLRAGKLEELEADYLTNLYRRGENHRFKIANGELIGKITNIDKRGRLIVTTEKGEQHFDLKEISFADY